MTEDYRSRCTTHDLPALARLLREDQQRVGETYEAWKHRLVEAYQVYREDYEVYFDTGAWPQRSARFRVSMREWEKRFG